MSLKFSIITPSFRNSAWLKLCIASIADQGVELELGEKLRDEKKFSAASELSAQIARDVAAVRAA